MKEAAAIASSSSNATVLSHEKHSHSVSTHHSITLHDDDGTVSYSQR